MQKRHDNNVGVTGTILVVDDDPDVRAVITDGLLSLGYAVHTTASAEDALVTLEKTPPDLVLTDVHMGATTSSASRSSCSSCAREWARCCGSRRSWTSSSGPRA